MYIDDRVFTKNDIKYLLKNRTETSVAGMSCIT